MSSWAVSNCVATRIWYGGPFIQGARVITCTFCFLSVHMFMSVECCFFYMLPCLLVKLPWSWKGDGAGMVGFFPSYLLPLIIHDASERNELGGLGCRQELLQNQWMSCKQRVVTKTLCSPLRSMHVFEAIRGSNSEPALHKISSQCSVLFLLHHISNGADHFHPHLACTVFCVLLLHSEYLLTFHMFYRYRSVSVESTPSL